MKQGDPNEPHFFDEDSEGKYEGNEERKKEQNDARNEDARSVESFPKIAHLSWKTEVLPAHWAPSLASWRRLHPEWEVILWTDTTLREFMESVFPDRLALYDSFKYNIQRVDMARYCLLEHHGGVWCDLDIEPVVNLEAVLLLYYNMGARVLISESAVVHRENKNLTNAFMASVPRHPFWSAVYEVLKHPYKHAQWWKKVVGASKHYKIIFTSGPGIVNTACKLFQADKLAHEVVALPRAFLQFSPHWEARPAEAQGAVARILKGQSWHSLDSTIATQADKWWSHRDEWAIPLMVIFFILACVFVGLYAVQRKRLRLLERSAHPSSLGNSGNALQSGKETVAGV